MAKHLIAKPLLYHVCRMHSRVVLLKDRFCRIHTIPFERVVNIIVGEEFRIQRSMDPGKVSWSKKRDASPDHHRPTTTLLHWSDLMRLQTVVLSIAVVVTPAKEPHTTDHALIRGQDPLSVIHRPVKVLLCKSVLFLHIMRFEIWPFRWTYALIPSCRRFRWIVRAWT